ncbi:MAG: hypothetical protein AB7S39_13160 [Gemmatimonadales bacterium]
MPVADSASLFAPTDVHVVGTPPPGLLSDDMRFLGSFVRIAAPFWADGSGRGPEDQERLSALAKVLGLDKETTLARLVDAAAATVPRADWMAILRLGRIVGLAGIKPPDHFPWLLANNETREASEDLLGPLDPWLADLLPQEWAAARRIADAYFAELGTDDASKWMSWARSPASRLLPFPLPEPSETEIYDRDDAASWLRSRGAALPPSPDARPPFTVRDFRFDPDLWKHWATSVAQPRWSEITQGLLLLSAKRRNELLRASLLRSKRPIVEAPAEWVVELAKLPCLLDERGTATLPRDLLIRTPDTERLTGAARFVATPSDTEDSRPMLLALGVRGRPGYQDVERLVGKLRSLSNAQKPPVRELISIYEALDQTIPFLSPTELEATAAIFRDEPLIRSDADTWECSASVARANPLAVSGAVTVLDAVGRLALWRLLGVKEEPDRGHLASWLANLPTGQRLEGKDLRRARQVLAVTDTWDSHGRWLAVNGSLQPVGSLRYHTKAPENLPALFPHMAETIADASMLAGTAAGGPLVLPQIDGQFSNQVESAPSARPEQAPPWFGALQRCVTRLPMTDEARVSVGAVLDRLAVARWFVANEVVVGVSVGGEPAGPSQTTMAAWHDNIVYVVGRPAQHHLALKAALSRPLDTEPLVAEAVGECVGRDPGWVEEFLDDHLGLVSEAAAHDSQDLATLELRVKPVATASSASAADAGPTDRASATQSRGASRGWRTAVPVLGGAGGRLRRSGGPTDTTGTFGWRDVCVAYLLQADLIETETGLAAPNGGRAELPGRPVHYQVLDRDGTLVEQGYVLPASLWAGEPVEIPAEVWLALTRQAQLSYLLFVDDEGEVSRGAFEGFPEQVDVHPAVYRLRVRDDNRSGQGGG